MKRTGMGWQLVGGLLLVAALAGCQPERPKERQSQAPPQPATVAEARPAEPAAALVSADTLPSSAEAEPVEPVWRVVSNPALRRVLQVHRYVGTVGGQPATAELQWYTPDSITGSFYLHRAGPVYALRDARQKPGPVVLTVDTDDYASAGGRWHLRSRPGMTVLKALWDDGHRRRTIAMRESYVGAVRYGIRTVLYSDGLRGSLLHDFLTLPAPGTVPRRLRPQLSPGPKALLQQLTEARDSLCEAQRRLCVRLNDYGLFSYQLNYNCSPTDAGVAGGVGLDSFLFDLVNGQPLTVESQLRPGYEKPLRRLLVRHLPSDLVDICLSKYLLLTSMPDAGMCLTRSGLEAAYAGPIKCGILSISVPYRELRPLVRPGTPLARMLAARNIW